MTSRSLCVAILSLALLWGASVHAEGPQPTFDLSQEFTALEARISELSRQAGATAANGAVDHATRALATAREAVTANDEARARRALSIADAAVLLAERQAARARAVAALATSTQARAAAEARARAAREALAAARADSARLERSAP